MEEDMEEQNRNGQEQKNQSRNSQRGPEWNWQRWSGQGQKGPEWNGQEDIAEKIRNAVSEALDSMEFDQLNQAIGDTVNSALNEARNQVEKYRDKMAGWQKQAQEKPKPLEIRVNWRGKVSGILFTIFGGIGSGVFGLLTLVILAAMMTSVQNPVGWWMMGILGIFAAGFGGMLFAGIRNNGRIGRLKRYVKELKRNGKPYCDLERLSKNCATSLAYLRKDLKKMIGLGMLPDARMDDQGTCLMLDDETYRQYRMAQASLEERQKEEREKERRQWEERPKDEGQQDEGWKEAQRRETARNQGTGENAENTALQEAIRHGEAYMETLDGLRASMPCQPIAEKLKRLDAVLERLFEALRKHPEQLDEMERFMEYYLPTTVKLVTAYQEFAAVEFPGENVNRAKMEIEETLDTINGAFEKLLDDLYQDAAFDILTDASVLQSMLAREGLTERDFK